MPGSGLLVVAGAVVWVVGVVCTPDSEPLGVPGAVLCVVGVVCILDAVPLGVVGAVPCDVGVEGCAGWEGVVEWAPWPETAPDEGELPRSA